MLTLVVIITVMTVIAMVTVVLSNDAILRPKEKRKGCVERERIKCQEKIFNQCLRFVQVIIINVRLIGHTDGVLSRIKVLKTLYKCMKHLSSD